ncbi:MAG TPA: sigma-70 family RNA polymerase sigma factor [Gaiellaceae bacterium]|nr:sigma-70 family RNA polymerase sigma factor [Gaiellaceae bacterium]
MSPLLLKRLSDEQLGGRLASGEAAAFDELYRRYAHRLSAYGAHLLGDGAAGEDVSQSTLLKAYGALRDGQVPDRIKPWLYRIAHNTAIDLVVRRREVPSAELPEQPSGGGEPVAGALVAALASLPDRQRRVYALREVHGLRIDETASELGLTAAQVEQALFAARNRLAEQLVFGDRLNCVAVRRLADGPLDLDERRALKTHLRSCASCRGALGTRSRVFGVFGPGSFDWLRGLFAGLAGGGAPVVAKVGVVVATATLAAGMPGSVEHPSLHFRLTGAHAAAAKHAPPPPVVQPMVLALSHAPVAIGARGAPVAVSAAHRTVAFDGQTEDGAGGRLAAGKTASVERGGDGGSGGGDGSTSGVLSVAPPATTPESGGSSSDGGNATPAPTTTTGTATTSDGADQSPAVQAPVSTAPQPSASDGAPANGGDGSGSGGGSSGGQDSSSADSAPSD